MASDRIGKMENNLVKTKVFIKLIFSRILIELERTEGVGLHLFRVLLSLRVSISPSSGGIIGLP